MAINITAIIGARAACVSESGAFGSGVATMARDASTAYRFEPGNVDETEAMLNMRPLSGSRRFRRGYARAASAQYVAGRMAALPPVRF